MGFFMIQNTLRTIITAVFFLFIVLIDSVTGAQESERLFDEIFQTNKPQQARGLHTGEIGQVRDMILPPGWRQGERRGGQIFSLAFHPASNPEASLVFRYRGFRVSKEAAAGFSSILSQKPGKLDHTDLRSLPEIIGNIAKPEVFSFDHVLIEEINGRRVLSIKGNYTNEHSGLFALYGDADRSAPGTVVQEISFSAPPVVFERYLPEMIESLHTILWK